MSYRKIFSRSTAYSLAVTLGRFANIFLMLAVAAKYSSDFVGNFALLQSGAGFLITALSFSLGPALNVATSRARAENTSTTEPIAFGAIYSTAAAVIAAVAVILFPSKFGTQNIYQTLFLVAFAANGIFQSVLNNVLIGADRVLTAALVSAAPPIAVLFAVLVSPPSPTGFMTLYGITLATSSLLAAQQAFKIATPSGGIYSQAIAFGRRQFRNLATFGLKTTAASAVIALAIWQLQLHLSAVAGHDENAIFAVGSQFFNVVLFFPTAISPVLLSQMAARKVGLSKLVFQLTIAIFALCALGVILWATLVHQVLALLPPLYARSEAAIIWALVGSSILFVKAPSALYMQSIYKTGQEVYSAIFSVLFLLAGIHWLSISSGVDASALRACAMAIYFLATLPAVGYSLVRRG